MELRITKTCPRCGLAKSVLAFNRRIADKYGLAPYCRRCGNAIKADWDRANPDRNLLKKYGLTETEYNAMLDLQNDGCAICKARPNGMKLCVDHDRSCCPTDITCGGCVRALLCTRCNLTLGKVCDSPELLEDMALYLRTHERSSHG